MNILVKYCGGCNCQIDRSKLVGDIKTLLPAGNSLISDAGAGPADAGLLLCGCPSACAQKPELADLAPKWILVAGKTVNHQDVPEDCIALAVLEQINKIKD